MSVIWMRISWYERVRAMKWSTILGASLLVTACVAPSPTEVSRATIEAPPGFPFSFYQQALADGKAVYAVRPQESLVRIYAYRTGALSRMGHDHVISSRTVEGMSVTSQASAEPAVLIEADLYMPLQSMLVDEQSLRLEAGFTTEVSERARSGTRANMLSSLGATEFPQVLLHIEASVEHSGLAATEILLQVTITMHGVTTRLSVPATVSLDAAGWRAEGQFPLRQTDFGIEPHSALGGALSVMDELKIAFELNAVRLLAN